MVRKTCKCSLAVTFVLLMVVLPQAGFAAALVDLNAEGLPLGAITSWTNTGTLGGNFGDDGTGPTVKNMGGKRCVYFDGNDRMKSSFNAPSGITGNGDHSVAVWAYNPAIGSSETLLSWSKAGSNGRDARFCYGSSTSTGAHSYYGTAYSQGFSGGAPSAGSWHHICITFSGSLAKVYVDGVYKNQKSMTLNIYTNLPLYLGVGKTKTGGFTSYFSGYIYSAQVYDYVLGQTEITNLVGRSAEVYYSNETEFSDSDPNINVRKSQHVRIVWGKTDQSGLMNEDYVQGNLYMFENCWKKWYVDMGYHEPRESIDPAWQDGKWYKTNVVVGATGLPGHEGGGNWLGVDAHSFGYVITDPWSMRWDPPSGATPHEYGHVYEYHAESFNGNDPSGFWWECMANWMMLQFEDSYPDVAGFNMSCSWYQAHGRHYYDNWHIFEYLMEQPGYGYAFVNTLWTQANHPNEYILDAMVRLDPSSNPDKLDQVKDNFGDMAAHNVTWDYGRHNYFVADAEPMDNWRRGRAELIAKPGATTVWRCPWEMAPQQMGYNIIPLTMPGKTGSSWVVTVNLTGFANPARGSDWRATLVAVSDTGTPRYSTQWSTGSNSMTLGSNENQLYLAVSGTPSIMPILPGDDFRSLQKETFPYEMTLTNCAPSQYVWSEPAVPHHHHTNGGGFVADTATVDATAYVGPNAQVLDSAQVRNNARIEDYARVQNSAQVRDNAIVSGHGWVGDSAQVYGNAKVRDYAACIESCKIYGNARIIERATIASTMDVYENAVLKGHTWWWDASGNDTGYVRGYAILDADATDGASLDHGVFMGWLRGQDYANGLPDNKGMYCGFTFQNTHPFWAYDTYGITHGVLIGNPTYVTDPDINRDKVLELNGSSQYVELREDVSDVKDITVMGWVYWTGTTTNQMLFSFGDGAAKYMYLTPKDGTNNKLKFVITTSGAGGEQSLVGTAAIPSSTWTHVAVVLSGTTGKLYVGGLPVATGTISIDPDQLLAANLNSTPNCNYLGRGAGGNYYKGRIDDFRVYVRPLTDQEVYDIATKTIRIVPQMDELIFGCDTDDFPDSGPTGPWIPFYPPGLTLTPMASPTVDVLGGVKWELNLYADGDGYDQGSYSSPIACNGASIVIAVKPTRNTTGTPWISCVDVFYDRLVLGVHNDTGLVVVRRNGSLNDSTTAIPNGQMTVLSLVVQPSGTYEVWANGTEIMNNTTTSDMTSLVPGVAGSFAYHINVGRNWPDGWTTFNGDIGDVFLYKIALSDADRQTLEADIRSKFGF